jgi:hypothetical protein
MTLFQQDLPRFIPCNFDDISFWSLKVAGQLDSVHQVTALCHNDCFHIAHQLLLLKFQVTTLLFDLPLFCNGTFVLESASVCATGSPLNEECFCYSLCTQ